MHDINILILMGGRTSIKDSAYPLYLSELNGKTLIEIQIEKFLPLIPKLICFCAKKDDLIKFNLKYTFKQIYQNVKTYEINKETKGAICSSLLAIDSINNNNELIILAVDDFIDVNIERVVAFFRQKNADAGFVYFKSIHPKYAFATINEEEIATGFSEKKATTSNALASFYYFKKGCDFVEASKTVIKKDAPISNNFYISQSLNELILLDKKIYGYKILPNQYHSLKTEKDLNYFLFGADYEKIYS